MADWLTALKEDWVRELFIFALGGVGGFLIRQFTMSKKERRDDKQMSYENTRELKRNTDKVYKAFVDALKVYLTKQSNQTLVKEDLANLATAADSYFEELKLIGNAVLDDVISPNMRDNDFVPLLVEAAQKSLPAYYKAMEKGAKATSAPWPGKLQENNYKSIYKAVRQYAPNESIPTH